MIGDIAAERYKSIAPMSENTVFDYDMQVFISEGMPEGALRQLFLQALDFPPGRIRFVLRGFEPQKMGELIRRLRNLFPDPQADKIIIEIDPNAFRHYKVEAVPVYLVKDKEKWFEVQGSISLLGAVEHVKRRGSYNVGELYQIKEPDILAVIEQRIKDYDWSKALARAQQRMAEKLSPGFDLPTATKTETSYFVPKFTLPDNIVIPGYNDNSDRIIAKAGDIINILEHKNLDVPIIVFDQEDRRQIEIVKDLLKKHPKADLFYVGVVVPKGNKNRQIELSREFNMPVYPWFPKLTDRFGVNAVPALVTQEGKKLRIDYYGPDLILK